ARARSDAPPHARSDRRPARTRTGLRRRSREWLPVARVRRLAPPPAGAFLMDDRVAPALPDGRRAVVYALRRRGQATADDIARQLDMTVSGARQHLTALVADGLAEATELPRPPGQRGRAQLAYMVTERADTLFPKAYGELTNELLGYASEADSGLVDTLFQRRRDERIRNATARLATKRGLKAKVA